MKLYRKTSLTRNDPVVGFKFLLVEEVETNRTNATNPNELDGFKFSSVSKSVFAADPSSPVLRLRVNVFASKV